MIKVFYTPFTLSDATEKLFKEALRHACRQGPAYHNYSGILYLAPSDLKVKDSRRVFHKLITSDNIRTSGNGPAVATNDCYIPPEISTIRQLAKRVYSEEGDRRMLPAPVIPVVISMLSGRGTGLSSLAADLINDIKTLYPDTGIDNIRDTFASVMNDLNIPESLTKSVLGHITTTEKYNSFLEQHRLVDMADVLNACPEYLSSCRHDVLIIDGFCEMTMSERNLLKTLINNSGHALISIPYEKDFHGITDEHLSFLKDNFGIEEIYSMETPLSPQPAPAGLSPGPLTYTSYPGPEQEVEGIARRIKSLFTSGKFQELEKITVAFPDLGLYSPIVERVFTMYGIPCNISSGRPLSRMRPFLDLLSLTNSVADNYPRLKFSQFLSSAYFSRIPESLKTNIPSLSLRSGIVSGKDSWLKVVTEGSEAIVIRDHGLEKDLRFVFSLLKPLEDLGNSSGLEAYATALSAILNQLGFLESVYRGSDRLEAPPFTGEKKAWDEILGHLSSLSELFRQEISLHEFNDLLAHLFNRTFMDDEIDGVQVAGLYEVAGLSPEYLFIGGMTDSAIPNRDKSDYLLPDSMKRRLGFMHLDRHIELQRFLFSYITASSRNLSISYPVMQGEDMFLPSSFLYTCTELSERIPGIYSPEEYYLERGTEPLSGRLTGIRDRSFGMSREAQIKVTDIDAYRGCPRRFFIEKVLQISPPDIKEYELEAVTIGNIMHRIMEKVVKEPMESLEYLRTRAESIVNEAMHDIKIDAYWKDLIRDTFLGLLPEIYQKETEIRTEDYISSELERNIAGEPVEGIKLKGKIDRCDKYRGSGSPVNIIDYKTGGASLNCKQVLEGKENLQLFLYASLLKNHGYNIGKVGIYSLKEINIKWCPPRARSKGQGTKGRKQKEDSGSASLDEYIVASLKFLERAVKEMRDGDFRAEPLNDFNCRTCHEYSLCPYVQQ